MCATELILLLLRELVNRNGPWENGASQGFDDEEYCFLGCDCRRLQAFWWNVIHSSAGTRNLKRWTVRSSETLAKLCRLTLYHVPVDDKSQIKIITLWILKHEMFVVLTALAADIACRNQTRVVWQMFTDAVRKKCGLRSLMIEAVSFSET